MAVSIDVSVGVQLAGLRATTNLKQAQVAKKMTVPPTRVSRIESGDAKPSAEEIEQYLVALGTQEARDFAEYWGRDWSPLLRPPFDHPNQEEIWKAVELIHRLDDLLKDPDLKGVFLKQVDLYRTELVRLAEYLLSCDHKVVFIGPIGVGKSTTLCFLNDLVVGGKKGTKLSDQVILEAGGGGITLCEVHVQEGPHFGLIVEPLPEEAVRQDVADFCEYLLQSEGADRESLGISKEVIRAIRNMAGLQVTRRKQDGKLIRIDPAKALAAKYPSERELLVQILAMMDLPRRDKRDVWYPKGESASPSEWLKATFEAVNNGRHPEFSLPRRIEVVLPDSILQDDELTLRLIDTKGIDQTAKRQDLECHFDDPRAVTVLCSRFAAAPEPPLQSLLERATEAGIEKDSLELGTMILVLPRPEEAAEMKDDSGGRAADDEEGYLLKQEQIDIAISHLGLEGLEARFFNATSDDVDELRQALLAKVRGLRAGVCARIDTLEKTVEDLLENLDEEQTRAIFETVSKRLRTWLRTHSQLAGVPADTHRTLLQEVGGSHQRTLWAAVRRNGNWSNLNYYYQLGVGARRLAAKQFKGKVSSLIAVVDNLLEDSELDVAHSFLEQVKNKIREESTATLRRVQLAGRSAFESELRSDSTFWSRCDNEYGRGIGGYRDTVRGYTKDWFDQDPHKQLHSSVIKAIEEGWGSVITTVQGLVEAAPA